MFRTTFVVLVAMACVQARPQLQWQHLAPAIPSSSGTSNSAITKGETITPFGGMSTIVQQQSGTGGQTFNGGTNFGTASSNTQSLNTPQGISTTSNTDTKSVQGSNPVFNGLGDGLFLPSIPAIPGFPSSAQGQSGSNIVRGETIGPHGGKTTTIQQQSGTGGQVSNGGSNVGSASSNTQSLNTPHGISSTSNTDAQSVQNSNSAFLSFGDAPRLPVFPAIPVFGSSSAQGQSGSNILNSETIGPHGGRTTTVQQQSGTGGQVSNGGSNVGSASSNTQSQNTPHGISSTSNTDAQSVQNSNSAFPIVGGGFGHPIVPAIHGGFGFGIGSASGTSGSNIVRGETITPFGDKTTTVQQQSGTGGQVSNGGSNFGSASSNTQSLNTPHGVSSTSNTDAQSVQNSNAAFPGFGGAPGLPGFPAIPAFDFGSATGSANSGLTQSKTTGADGSQNTVTVLGSSAGGSAQDGGTSVNSASGSTSSIDGISGSQTQSSLDSQSIQTSGR